MALKKNSGISNLQDQYKKNMNNTSEPPKNNAHDEIKPNQTELEQKQENPQKRKAGRPKTKDIKNTCKNINVAVPITLLDKWENIKIVHGSNLTEYITKLIEKDMNANYEHYNDIANSLKNI